VQFFKTPLWKVAKAHIASTTCQSQLGNNKNNFPFASPKSQIRVESIKGGETLFVKYKSIGLLGA
jgi:hypothetical protein